MVTQHQRLAVSVTGLRKSCGDKTVLDGLDLAIPKGTVFACSPERGGQARYRTVTYIA